MKQAFEISKHLDNKITNNHVLGFMSQKSEATAQATTAKPCKKNDAE